MESWKLLHTLRNKPTSAKPKSDTSIVHDVASGVFGPLSHPGYSALECKHERFLIYALAAICPILNLLS